LPYRKGIVVAALKEYEIYGLVRGNRIVYIDYILLDDREPMYIYNSFLHCLLLKNEHIKEIVNKSENIIILKKGTAATKKELKDIYINICNILSPHLNTLAIVGKKLEWDMVAIDNGGIEASIEELDKIRRYWDEEL
jgi:hypothetical protein